MSVMNLEGDLGTCLTYNPIHGIDDDTVTEVLAEIIGDNDGPDWAWVVSLKDGKFAGIVGGCDYTGWDCRSSASGEFFDSADEAAVWCTDGSHLSLPSAEALVELRSQIQKAKPVASRTQPFT